MNYYNPYFYGMPTSTTNTGLFSRLFSAGGFNKFINNTERVLSFANQAIPFVKQVKPIIGNAKTMFKVMNEFKKSEHSSKQNTSNTINQSNISNDGPKFFI